MGFSVDGIATGLPTDQMISQLLALEQRPIQLLKKRQDQFSRRLTAVQDLNAKVAALKSSAELVESSFQERKVSVTNSEILGASASDSAQPGVYQVTVKQLAQAHKIVAQGVDDADTTEILGADGVFSFRIGGSGEVTTINLEAGSTIRDLANAINDADAGVHASIINDGSSKGAYRLVLTATQTGTAGAISVVTNDTTLDFDNKAIGEAEAAAGNSGTYTGAVQSGGAYTGTGNKTYLVEIMSGGAAGAATYRYSTDGGVTWDDNGGAGYTTTTAPSAIGGNTEGVQISFQDDGSTLSQGDRFSVDVFDPLLQEARDAALNVDGIDIQTSSNSVSSVIDGVTLDLREAAPGEVVTVTVERNDTAVYEKVNGFITSYNAIVSFLNQQSAYNEKTKKAGVLSGDATIRAIGSRFRAILGAPVPGMAADEVNSLAMIGVKAAQNGVFEIDRSKFDEMLREQPDEVQRILLGGGETSTSKISFVSKSESNPGGSFALQISGVGDDRRVTLDGDTLEIEGDTLKGVAGTRFEGLVLEVEDLANQPEGMLGTVTLFSGITEQVHELAEQMLDTTSGILKGKQKAIQATIDDINQQIDRQQARISEKEKRLKARFTALEVTMGKLKTQSDFVSQQLLQLQFG